MPNARRRNRLSRYDERPSQALRVGMSIAAVGTASDNEHLLEVLIVAPWKSISNPHCGGLNYTDQRLVPQPPFVRYEKRVSNTCAYGNCNCATGSAVRYWFAVL